MLFYFACVNLWFDTDPTDTTVNYLTLYSILVGATISNYTLVQFSYDSSGDLSDPLQIQIDTCTPLLGVPCYWAAGLADGSNTIYRSAQYEHIVEQFIWGTDTSTGGGASDEISEGETNEKRERRKAEKEKKRN